MRSLLPHIKNPILSLIAITTLLSSACFAQSVEYWSYSVLNSNCHGTDVELYSNTEQSLCAAISNNFVQSTQCSWQDGNPTASISTSLVRNWIVEGAPAHCFVIVHVDRTYPAPLGSDSHDIYFDGGGGGQAMHKISLQFFSTATPPPTAEPNACCANAVADPINPASGAVYDTQLDVPQQNGAITFKRFYNSTGSGAGDVNTGWRQSYSRHVQSSSQSAVFRRYVASNPDNSSLYSDASTACVSGFAEIQSRVPNWAGTTPTYEENLCKLIKNGRVIGILSGYYRAVLDDTSEMTAAVPGLSTILPAPIAYDVVRDDGQVIHFTVQSGVITAPPGVNLALQQTASGYTLADANDAVELYDTNGKLLSITSRAGVVQNMSYDSSGRLSSVIDSFGKQLMLSYDGQNRLISVVRQ